MILSREAHTQRGAKSGRRKQPPLSVTPGSARGPDEVVLDGVQFGCLISRAAKSYANRGEWILSRVRARRSYGWKPWSGNKSSSLANWYASGGGSAGCPCPSPEKILPFREPPGDDDSTSPVGEGDVTMPSRAEAAQARATDAWSRLDAAA